MPLTHDSEGVVSIPSPHSVEETLARLKTAIVGKELTLFADVDHALGARQVGLQMQPAHVLIFGHPKAGTPLMVVRPLLALDLPLKVLVWQDAEGKVFASFNSPEYLAKRHSIPPEMVKNISGVEGLVKAALAQN